MVYNCRKCNIVLDSNNRSPSSGYICKDCQREYQREYRIANDDILSENKHNYYLDNAEIIKERSRDYHDSHREKNNKRRREANYAKGAHPMSENRDCPVFLGVYIAENVLSLVFKDVKRMPYGNPGFDFICGGGYKVDSKSVCISKYRPAWIFNIRKNKIADYFIFLAFNDRIALKPQHCWLVPSDIVNEKNSVYIAISAIDKWDKYKIDINKVIECCEEFKSGNII